MYPDSYNLADKSCTTPVKDQRDWGYCWAYAVTTSMESFMLNKTRSSIEEDCDNIDIDYNPMHIGYSLAYKFANNIYNPYGTKDLGSGGNSIDNLVYYASGIGPASSVNFPITSEAPKSNLKITDVFTKTENVKLDNMYLFPQIDVSIASSSELNEFVNLIKKTILEKGAISFSSGGPGGAFYNPNTFAVKTNNIDEVYSVPHMMTIVGWDDNFSKNNFSTGHIPNNNGAWIVQNSWGSDSGNNGFYYYSYEDYGLNIWDLV